MATLTTHQLDRCTNCGRFGWHETDRCPNTTMHAYELKDVHRRIRNILAEYPATDWTLDESKFVLAALAAVVQMRQAATR